MRTYLVCGGRDFTDRVRLESELDRLIGACGHPDSPRPALIHGAAKGVDRLAGDWAHSRGLRVREFPADWDRYGPRAGPIRNAQMLREGRPDVVISFPGGKGTADMKKQAKSAGIQVIEVDSQSGYGG